MSISTKRSTIYLSEDLHKALKVKAAVTHNSISDLVNQAVKQALIEDSEDLLAFKEREKEPDYDFENVLKDLKKRGKI
ncbi:MAG: ribbon-helix-helix protein, CopG family [Spirochaetes bacterium]|nr:ribbon-helix-helix protein, CopG family [Spirochaetota bacterium]